MEFLQLVRNVLTYDKNLYDGTATKRMFRRKKLVANRNHYNLIKESIFDEFNLPTSRIPNELKILLDVLNEFPSIYLKIVEPYYLCRLLLEMELTNIRTSAKTVIYPLCYVKIYLPNVIKIKVIVKVYNACTPNETHWLIQELDLFKSEDIYKYYSQYIQDWNSGKVDSELQARKFISLQDAFTELTKDW